MKRAIYLLFLLPLLSFSNPTMKTVIANLDYLKFVGIKPIMVDQDLKVGYAILDEDSEMLLSMVAHANGRCGGFEVLSGQQRLSPEKLFTDLRTLKLRDQRQEELLKYNRMSTRISQANPTVEEAISEVQESELRNWVSWLSSFVNRFHRDSDPNKHVVQLKTRLEEMARLAPFPVAVDQLDHRSTEQDSLRVTIQGSQRPDEIIVLGGHLDSINQWGFFDKRAPGSDDNASGSANLLEALRIILKGEQPQRTIEFFWYAGEEAGLLGSAEIAESYKNAGKNVIAVLQLDMTLRPGSGRFVLGSMTDFTSPWLRDFLEEINDEYIGAEIVYDQCGYGCSDHASWYRQGYSTIMPFESDFDNMNHQIHTAQDVVNNESDFSHSAMFSKIALAFALELANSDRHGL